MPDERRDSIEQGIGAPDESPKGREARRLRTEDDAEIGGGMGGTSDSDTAGEEADFERKRHDGGRRAGHHRGPGEGAD